MLALDGDNDRVKEVLNAWVDGVDAKIAWHCCLGAGYGNPSVPSRTLPRVLERWMDVNVEQYALDFGAARHGRRQGARGHPARQRGAGGRGRHSLALRRIRRRDRRAHP
jgi:hypothetical protein